MLAAIVPFGLTWHMLVTGRITAAEFNHANTICIAWLVVITIATTSIPLWVGQRSLTRREY
jgi:hypothetical protein